MKEPKLNKPLALTLALRLLSKRSSQRRGGRVMVAAIASIALSMIPLVLVLEVSDGMIRGILARYMETADGHLRVFFPEQLAAEELQQTRERLQQQSAVNYVGIELQGPALAFFRGKRQPISLRGVDPEWFTDDPGARHYLRLVAGERVLDGDGLLVGEVIAEKLGVTVGDRITLLSAAQLPLGGYLPKTALLQVVGIVSGGYRELDKLWVFSSYHLAANLLHTSSRQQSLMLKVADPLPIDINFKRRLRQDGDIPLSAVLLSWRDLSDSLRNNFLLTQAILLLAMALIIILSVSNVSSSLLILGFENQQQIGIMKSFGASSGLIMRVFLLVGLLSTVIAVIPGVLLGILLSLLVNQLVLFANLAVNKVARLLELLPADEVLDLLNSSFYLEQIPVEIRFAPLLLLSLLTVFLGGTAALLPSIKAGRLRPINLLQN